MDKKSLIIHNLTAKNAKRMPKIAKIFTFGKLYQILCVLCDNFALFAFKPKKSECKNAFNSTSNIGIFADEKFRCDFFLGPSG